MERAHIAVFVSQHPPSLIPTLPIVATLVRRGHRVSFVTSPRFRQRVETTGSDIVECENYPNTNVTDVLDWNEETLASSRKWLQADRPDLILYELFNFGGLVLAREWNIPSVQVSPLFALDRDHFTQQTENHEWHRILVEIAEEFEALMKKHGIDTDFFFHRDALNIFYYPRAFQRPGNAFDESCFYAGSCAGDQPRIGSWQNKLAGKKPIVLVSASTTYPQGLSHFRMCIEALAPLSVHTVVCLGDRSDISPADLEAPNVEVVQRVSLVHILESASLFICQGGNQSVSEATYYGVPLIFLTKGSLDLEWHANHYARLGIGLHLKGRETTVVHIRAAACETLEGTRIKQRVAEMQRIMWQEPNSDQTAQRIERHLAESRAATSA